MICKWCGAEISDSATKCARCRKDLPAMSDCGGFYNLVPNAQKSAIEPQPDKPIPPEPVPAKNAPQPVSKKTKGRKKNPIGIVVTCTGFVLAVVLAFSLVGQTMRYQKEQRQLKMQIEKLSAELNQKQQETTEPAATEPEATEPSPAEQNVEIVLSLGEEEGKPVAEGTYTVGDREAADFDADDIQMILYEQTHTLETLQLKREGKVCIEMHFNGLEITHSDPGNVFSVDMGVDKSVFGEVEGEVKWNWEYRPVGTEQWLAPDETVFTIPDAQQETNEPAEDESEKEGDQTEILYNAEDFADLLKRENAEAAEFRFTYMRTNKNGNTLTVTVSGIRIL